MKLQNKRGFTLIELLVVITIIGILATGATTVYTSQIQKARDTTRINDIKALQSAVEQVYQDSGEYPHGDEFDSSAKISAKTYLPKLPRDPKNGQTCNSSGKSSGGLAACVYAYNVTPDDNNINWGAYILSTGFESLGKVESDGTRDAGNHAWRWEVGNGVMMTSIPSSDPTATNNADCLAAAVRTHTGIYNNNCSSNSSLPTQSTLITIHGS